MLSALDCSPTLRGILGDAAVDATLAVRRFEQQHYGELSPAQLADKFRMAWSL